MQRPWPRPRPGTLVALASLLSIVYATTVDDGCSGNSRCQHLEALLLWLRAPDSVTYLDNVEAFVSPAGGIGLRAARPISADSILMSVDNRWILDADAALADPVMGPILADLEANVTSDGRVATTALYLMYEARYRKPLTGQASWWQPYIDILPQSFPEHPHSFSPSQRHAMFSIASLHALAQLFHPSSEDQLYFRDVLFTRHPQLFGEDSDARRVQWERDFAWAWTAVSTRMWTFQNSTRGGEPMGRMTPLMDCVNHSPASSTVAVNAEFRRPQPWRPDFPEGFGLAYVADRDYNPGEEVWAVYTRASQFGSCNVNLFATFGFTVDDVASACFEFTITLTMAEQGDLVALLLDQLGLPVDILAQRESVVTSVTLRASDAQLPDHLLGFFRVLLASPEEQSALQLGVRIAGPISLESERRALVSLRSSLQRQALPQALQERVRLQERLQAGVQPPFPPSVVDSLLRIADGQIEALHHAVHLVEQTWMSMIL